MSAYVGATFYLLTSFWIVLGMARNFRYLSSYFYVKSTRQHVAELSKCFPFTSAALLGLILYPFVIHFGNLSLRLAAYYLTTFTT